MEPNTVDRREPGASQEEEDTLDARVERLGRQRPEAFKTMWAEIGFCSALLGSMLMAEYFISGFNMTLPALATALEIPTRARTWPASVFSLVTGAFLLPFSRLADIYGGRPVFLVGLAWHFIWSVVGGFSKNYVVLIFCRALQGLGPAAFLPSGIMLLGRTYRPGPRKNLVFSLYGAFSPLGFFSGIFFGGVSGQYLTWSWYFWIGSVLLFLLTAVAYVAVPKDYEESRCATIKMDWLGAFTIVPGLLLIVFAITDSSHAPQHWATPYVSVTIAVGILLLCGAFYVEGWIADGPLLPLDLFKVRHMGMVSISLLLSYGVFGIYLFYASFYIEDVLQKPQMVTVAWFAPMAIGGLFLATFGGLVLHLLPGTVLLLVSGVGYILCVLLFAIIPDEPNYWAYVFPAMICGTLGVDVTYTVSNIFITTSMSRDRQGLAGALINSVLFLGISLFLGIADIAASASEHLGNRQSDKVAFWFGVGLAAASLLILLPVRIGRAKSDLTIEEKAELEAEVMLQQGLGRKSMSPSNKKD